jgi:uncharacterized membrane protein YphA (DoxX/SURF4 family)
MPTGRKSIIDHPEKINMKSSAITWVQWLLRILAAAIMLQTLYFKFTAAPESVYIFTQTGMEPWGRIGIGILELIASVLILYPRTTDLGALLAAGLMSGALYFHLTVLGFAVMDDGGQLFLYAVAVLLSALILLWINRDTVLKRVKFILAFGSAKR